MCTNKVYSTLVFSVLALLASCVCITGSAYANNCEKHFQISTGNVPILLTSPHGASFKNRPSFLPLREGKSVKRFVNRADQHTDEITERVAQLLTEKNIKPFIVIAGINRAQIDFNRPPRLAYEDVVAATCYRYYHDALKNQISTIKQKWPNGFLIDVHGQSKYSNYEVLRGTRNGQTITALRERFGKDVSDEEGGFYKTLRDKNYIVHPDKGEREQFYYGGYTVKQYGSHKPDGIDALQIEILRDIRIDEQQRTTFIKDMALAIENFYIKYYKG